MSTCDFSSSFKVPSNSAQLYYLSTIRSFAHRVRPVEVELFEGRKQLDLKESETTPSLRERQAADDPRLVESESKSRGSVLVEPCLSTDSSTRSEGDLVE